MRISVIGLGKLGAPLAAVLAYKGHEVIGVDVDERPIRLINEGKAPVYEPGLEPLIQASRERLSATGDYDLAVSTTEATFIIVPTPSDENGSFSLRYVLAAAGNIGRALRHKEGFHLVVLTSTVMPGATGGEVLPALEASSGRRCGRDFGLCYNPEFIALGSVIHDMLNPDFILIGESDPRSGDILSGIYHNLCENAPPIARMNFQRGTDQTGRQYFCDHQNFLRQHAGRGLRAPAGRRRGRGHIGVGTRQPYRPQVSVRRDRVRRPLLPPR
ncbi:MAG: hypothetical protein ACP5NB_13475 [Chloroflexia bacterium]